MFLACWYLHCDLGQFIQCINCVFVCVYLYNDLYKQQNKLDKNLTRVKAFVYEANIFYRITEQTSVSPAL